MSSTNSVKLSSVKVKREEEFCFDNPVFASSSGDNSEIQNTTRKIYYDRSISIIPDQIFYSWKDINVYAKAKKTRCAFPCLSKNNPEKEQKHIVKNVSGAARPGEILVIMGASGAGKTSLLNVLTFRNQRSVKVTGSCLVNGVAIDADMLTLISAYIQQDDVFIGTLTPREHLTFQALLRMDKHISHKERMARVEEVIQEMGLGGCADTIIGIPGRIKGISGGQKKRLSVASEIITDPKLLICDEPTTGLDSFMAQSLIKTLKTLATQGKTIICTIHQPASEIFALFDRLLLMSDGRIAYYGDAQAATTYFPTIGYPCPANYNPADFFIHTLAIRHGTEEICLQRSKDICDKYDQSENAKELETEVKIRFNEMKSYLPDEKVVQSLQKEVKMRKVSPYKASWFTQFRACLWRSAITILKDPMAFKIQLAQTIFIALVVGIIYFGQEMDQAGVQNISGCIFIIMANLTFSSIFPVTNVFWQELPVFLREHFSGMYRTSVSSLS